MTLKEFVMQCHLPVIMTVPLSRSIELRADRRPRLSDIRWHRRFADEADAVVLLYRDSCCSGEETDPDPVEWIVAKNSRGEEETIRAGIRKASGRYVCMR